jgi:ferric-dicitrate binding protein FerR (iron transport regulator)
MRLGRDTILKLGEQARLVIDEFLIDSGGEITLEGGAVLFDRQENLPPLQTLIRSAFGLIAVRGTRFFAGPSNDVFGVFVERGSLTVSAAGTTVTVRRGQGTNIARAGAASAPR